MLRLQKICRGKVRFLLIYYQDKILYSIISTFSVYYMKSLTLQYIQPCKETHPGGNKAHTSLNRVVEKGVRYFKELLKSRLDQRQQWDGSDNRSGNEDIKNPQSCTGSCQSLVWEQDFGAAAADDVHYLPAVGWGCFYEASGHESTSVWTGSEQLYCPRDVD